MYWSHKYLEIVRELDLDPTGDRESTQYLDRLLGHESLSDLEHLVNGRPVMVYGCGPSLETDIQKILDAGIEKKFISASVDGSVNILLKNNIVPHINVSDLDGDLDSIVTANKHGTMTVLHAHAGNAKQIHAAMPRLTGRVFGITRSKPTEKVHSFGGFTDGDMTVALVDHFRPKYIVLAGMDYGRVIGVHSGQYNPIRKPRSMKASKRLLEEHAKKTNTDIFNMTSGGEYIKHTQHADIHKLKAMLGVRS